MIYLFIYFNSDFLFNPGSELSISTTKYSASLLAMQVCATAIYVRIIGLGPTYTIKSQRPIINVEDNNTTLGFKREISQPK